MLPALKEGDEVIFSKSFDKLERGDIIVFHYPAQPKLSYIKRVVGLPNDEIEIRQGKVFINGKIIDEPYVDQRLNVAMRSFAAVKVPSDAYFVMGDNRDNSSDSRIWGTLQRKFIYGRMIRKV